VVRLYSFLAVLLLTLVMPGATNAQTALSSRPIRVVVPFGPGGFADITMRLVGQRLAERTGTQVVIENRPSAGGIVAASAVTSAPPDGSTLFVLSSGIALSKSLLKSMPFDPATAFAPISTLALFDLLLLVKADSPLHSIKDALDTARNDPSKFNIGTINPGSTQNVTAELLRSATGLTFTIVPHRSSAEVLTSLLRGDTQIGVESYAALKSPIDSGQIRAIAATGDKRSSMQPNVPTLKESGVNAEVVGWNSLVAPAGTPKDVIATLNGHVRAIIESPDFQKRMLELGGDPKASTPEELAARLKSDIEMWAGVVKKAGLEPH
jgi:tripartite-type tricarboxylate transporter receptor subunit TctC